MKKKLKLVSILFLWVTVSLAAEQEFKFENNFEGSYTITSDHMSTRRFLADFHLPRTNLAWPFIDEPKEGTAWSGGVEVGQNRAVDGLLQFEQLHLKRQQKLSQEVAYTLGVGASVVSLEGESSHISPDLLGKFDYARDPLDASLQLRRYSLVHTVLGNVHSIQSHDSTELNPRINYRPHDRIRISTNEKFEFWTDGNKRNEYDLVGYYGIATTDPWVWIGPGVNYLTYSAVNSGYWSPRGFTSFGLRADVSIPIIANFAFNLGGSIHKTKEIDQPLGNGHYLNAGVTVGDRETHSFYVKYEDIRSTRDQSSWHSAGVVAGYVGPLPF